MLRVCLHDIKMYQSEFSEITQLTPQLMTSVSSSSRSVQTEYWYTAGGCCLSKYHSLFSLGPVTGFYGEIVKNIFTIAKHSLFTHGEKIKVICFHTG